MKKIIGFMLIGLLFLSACDFSVEVDDGSEEDTGTENTGGDSEEGAGDNENTARNNEETGGDEEKEPLQLQMTKVDEEAGATIEGNETYQILDEFVQENPGFGVANDFSMQSITMVLDAEGNQQMVFLAVNRLGEPITNVEFNFSLGNTDGDMVWEDFPVTIDEQAAGVLEDNSAMPIFLPITSEEQVELMNTISQENLYIDFADFNYESAG